MMNDGLAALIGILLFGVGAYILAKGVQRSDYLYVVLVILAFPPIMLGLGFLLQVSGLPVFW